MPPIADCSSTLQLETLAMDHSIALGRVRMRISMVDMPQKVFSDLTINAQKFERGLENYAATTQTSPLHLRDIILPPAILSPLLSTRLLTPYSGMERTCENEALHPLAALTDSLSDLMVTLEQPSSCTSVLEGVR